MDDGKDIECSQSDGASPAGGVSESRQYGVADSIQLSGGVKAPESAPESALCAGQGAILSDPHHVRQDALMIERAARWWDVPDIAMQRLPQLLYDKAIEANTLEAIDRATKTLAVLHGQNQAAARPAPVRQALTINNYGQDMSPGDRAVLAEAGRIMRQTAIPAG